MSAEEHDPQAEQPSPEKPSEGSTGAFRQVFWTGLDPDDDPRLWLRQAPNYQKPEPGYRHLSGTASPSSLPGESPLEQLQRLAAMPPERFTQLLRQTGAELPAGISAAELQEQLRQALGLAEYPPRRPPSPVGDLPTKIRSTGDRPLLQWLPPDADLVGSSRRWGRVILLVLLTLFILIVLLLAG